MSTKIYMAQLSIPSSNSKIHENPFGSSQVIIRLQTDGWPQ
jgi:hypothetical protein